VRRADEAGPDEAPPNHHDVRPHKL
jgi:hypothetical protein